MELLIFSLLCSVFSAFVPLLVKFVMNWLYRVSKEEITLQNEAISLKKQMDVISMVDEFAKHAKLQRKLIKVKDELKQRATARLSTLMKNKFLFTYLLHVVMGLTLLCIVWLYRNVPVIVFPQERLWPIADIVSWPTGVPGGVSVAVWIFCSNKVARELAAQLTSRFFADNKESTKKLEDSSRSIEKLAFFLQEKPEAHN